MHCAAYVDDVCSVCCGKLLEASTKEERCKAQEKSRQAVLVQTCFKAGMCAKAKQHGAPPQVQDRLQRQGGLAAGMLDHSATRGQRAHTYRQQGQGMQQGAGHALLCTSSLAWHNCCNMHSCNRDLW
jgi:hypothetical protein